MILKDWTRAALMRRTKVSLVSICHEALQRKAAAERDIAALEKDRAWRQGELEKLSFEKTELQEKIRVLQINAEQLVLRNDNLYMELQRTNDWLRRLDAVIAARKA